MPGKRIEVYYQAPGGDKWRQVESAEERPATARERVRNLLVESDAAAAVLCARTARGEADEGLSAEAAFERDMARAMGAWGRYVEVEAKRLYKGAEGALENLLRGKQGGGRTGTT
jgi:hypothetical protein